METEGICRLLCFDDSERVTILHAIERFFVLNQPFVFMEFLKTERSTCLHNINQGTAKSVSDLLDTA